jgi:hypothetical protein
MQPVRVRKASWLVIAWLAASWVSTHYSAFAEPIAIPTAVTNASVNAQGNISGDSNFPGVTSFAAANFIDAGQNGSIRTEARASTIGFFNHIKYLPGEGLAYPIGLAEVSGSAESIAADLWPSGGANGHAYLTFWAQLLGPAGTSANVEFDIGGFGEHTLPLSGGANELYVRHIGQVYDQNLGFKFQMFDKTFYNTLDLFSIHKGPFSIDVGDILRFVVQAYGSVTVYYPSLHRFTVIADPVITISADNLNVLDYSFEFSSNLPSTAVEMEFTDFSETSQITLNGSSESVETADGWVLRLASAVSTPQIGSAFSNATLNASSFSTLILFRITDPGGPIFDCNTEAGADGLVFVVQSVRPDISGIGGGIGYSGIDKSVGVEFDTWCNSSMNDPSSNHVGINTNGSVAHDPLSQDTASVTPNFDDGNIWSAWIDYNGTTLEVRVSQNSTRPSAALVSRILDIPGILGQTNAFVGFTSETGTDWGNHDIIYWKYRDQYDPISCIVDFDSDGDVDGEDLAEYAKNEVRVKLKRFAEEFGGDGCQ